MNPIEMIQGAVGGKRVSATTTGITAVVLLVTTAPASIPAVVIAAGVGAIAVMVGSYNVAETLRPSGKKGDADKPLDGDGESG